MGSVYRSPIQGKKGQEARRQDIRGIKPISEGPMQPILSKMKASVMIPCIALALAASALVFTGRGPDQKEILAMKEAAKQETIAKYRGKSMQQIRVEIRTPQEASAFIEAFYGPDSGCLDGAQAIAWLLHDDGYKPLIGDVEDGRFCHCVFLFQEEDGSWSAADNGAAGGYIHSARYKSQEKVLEAAGRNYGFEYIDKTVIYHPNIYAIENDLMGKGYFDIFKPEKEQE